jgi:hypothetical protein
LLRVLLAWCSLPGPRRFFARPDLRCLPVFIFRSSSGGDEKGWPP